MIAVCCLLLLTPEGVVGVALAFPNVVPRCDWRRTGVATGQQEADRLHRAGASEGDKETLALWNEGQCVRHMCWPLLLRRGWQGNLSCHLVAI